MRRRALRGTVGEKPVSAINELRPSVHLRAQGTPVVGRAHCGGKFLSLKRVNRCCNADASATAGVMKPSDFLPLVQLPRPSRLSARKLFASPTEWIFDRRRLIADGKVGSCQKGAQGAQRRSGTGAANEARELQRFGLARWCKGAGRQLSCGSNRSEF